MATTRKQVTMTVTVSVPKWMTAAEARREVRTLINDQCNYMDCGPGYEEVVVKARQVSPVRER